MLVKGKALSCILMITFGVLTGCTKDIGTNDANNFKIILKEYPANDTMCFILLNSWHNPESTGISCVRENKVY